MLKPLGYITFTLFLFFLMLFTFTKLAGPIPFQVDSIQTQKNDSFQVTGEGKAQIKPDQATVTVGVTAKAPTAKAAQDQMNTQINKVSEALRALGIDPKDIQTQNYNVNPDYDFKDGSQTIKGYSANTNLAIKVKKIEDADKILDTATANGATQVGGVSFDNADGAKSQAEDEARTKAVANAKKKAEQASETAGFQLGRLVNYQEGFNGGGIRPMMAFDKAAPNSATLNTSQVEPGENEIVVTVTLSYEVR